MGTLLRIVDMDDAFPKLKKANLDAVFQNIPEQAKVAVLGVCGNFREGKSFLLNVLLAALEDPTKMDDNATVFSGIPFSDGIDAHTKGILFWSKPLRLMLPTGETLFVILMDTQGTFDMQNDKRVSVQTFAIGNLLSSFLIFNRNKQLHSMDVEALQLFVQYGKHLRDNVGQHLLLLLRDHIQRDSGVNDEYIAHIQEKSRGSKDISTTLRDVGQAFEKFSCFTLTEPSRKVKMASGELTVEDCGEEFIEGMQDLMHYIRANIQEKRLGGAPLKADDLKCFIEAVVRSIRNGDAPEITSVYDTMERESLLKAEKEFNQIGDRLLSNLPKSGVDELMFERKMEELKGKLSQDFKGVTCFAKKEKMEALKKLAIKCFDEKAEDLCKVNATVHGKQRLTKNIHDLAQEYTLAMQPFVGTEEFEKKKTVEVDEAVAKLRKTCSQFPGKEESLQDGIRDLAKQIKCQSSLLESQHSSKVQLVIKNVEDALCRDFERSVNLGSGANTLNDARIKIEKKERETINKMRNNWAVQDSDYSLDGLEGRLRETKEKELRHVKNLLERQRREEEQRAEMQRMREMKERRQRQMEEMRQESERRERRAREMEREREEERRQARIREAEMQRQQEEYLREMREQEEEQRREDIRMQQVMAQRARQQQSSLSQYSFGMNMYRPQQYDDDFMRTILMQSQQQQRSSPMSWLHPDDSVSQIGQRSMGGSPLSTASRVSTSPGGRSFDGLSVNGIRLGRPPRGTLSPAAQRAADASTSSSMSNCSGSMGGSDVHAGSSQMSSAGSSASTLGPATSPGGRSYGGYSKNGIKLGRPKNDQ